MILCLYLILTGFSAKLVANHNNINLPATADRWFYRSIRHDGAIIGRGNGWDDRFNINYWLESHSASIIGHSASIIGYFDFILIFNPDTEAGN